MKTEKLTRLALLTAIASVIFIVELQFPDLIPITGVKAGLANIITVYVLYKYNWQDAVLVTLARIIIGTIFGGNISAIIYSLSGAFLALSAMIMMKKFIPKNHIWLCSTIGGISHNIGQTLAAIAVTGTFAVVSYLTILICCGCISGAFTGLSAQFAINRKIGKFRKK